MWTVRGPCHSQSTWLGWYVHPDPQEYPPSSVKKHPPAPHLQLKTNGHPFPAPNAEGYSVLGKRQSLAAAVFSKYDKNGDAVLSVSCGCLYRVLMRVFSALTHTPALCAACGIQETGIRQRALLG